MNQRGFTLIQTLIALALTAIIAAGTASVLTMSFRGLRSAERMGSMLQMADEMRMALAKESVCTPNFKGLNVNPNASLPVPSIYYYNENGDKAAKPMLMLGEELTGSPGLRISNLYLTPKAWLSADKLVMDLNITGTMHADDIGARESNKTIPLLVELKNGSIIRCVADADSGARFFEKVCMLSGDGRFYYDAESDRCVNRYDEEYFDGDQTTAACPAGWSPLPVGTSQVRPCDQLCTVSGGQDDNKDSFKVSTPRQYSDGSVRDNGPLAFYAEFSEALQRCQCSYASDLPAASLVNLKCRIKCQRLRVPFTF